MQNDEVTWVHNLSTPEKLMKTTAKALLDEQNELHLPALAPFYCDRVYETELNQRDGKAHGNIYLTLLQTYLKPRKTNKNNEKRIKKLVSSPSSGNLKGGWSSVKAKGKGLGMKIAEIEGAEDTRIKASSSDGGKSDFDIDSDDLNEEGGSTIMVDEVLDVLSQRWARVHGAKVLRLLPKETKLQVKDELYIERKAELKITAESVCSLCHRSRMNCIWRERFIHQPKTICLKRSTVESSSRKLSDEPR